MSRTERSHLLIGVTLVALALAGCGAGQVAQTAEQVASVGGANSAFAQVVLRDVQIEFGDGAEGAAAHVGGSDAPLSLTIVNQATGTDRLVSVTSNWASAVEFTPSPLEVPGGSAVVVGGELAAAPSRPQVSGAPSAPSPTSSAAPVGEPTAQIVLVDLLDDVQVGHTYEIVFTFENAGEISVQVPVGDSGEPREDEPAE